MTSDYGALEKSSDLLILSAGEHAEIVQALAALCPSWNLARVHVERFLAGGYSNRNYRIRYGEQRFVVRLPGTGSATDFANEMLLLHDLELVFEHAAGGPSGFDQRPPEMAIAETVAAVAQQGWLLTRWVEKPVLADTKGVTATQLAYYLAALHRRLQQLPADQGSATALVDSIVEDLGRVHPEPASGQRNSEHLLKLVQAASPAQVCHNDLNPWNLLFDGSNDWVTLDWETRNLAPPLFDLVVLCDGYALSQNYSAARTTELAQRCLGVYNRLMQTSGSLIELDGLRTLFRWREYAWAASRVLQGSLRSTVFDDVLAQRREYARLLAPQAAALGICLICD